MSIEMENPTTLLEKIDAASNYVAQAILANMRGDRQHVSFALEKAQELLFDATQMADEAQDHPTP